MHQDRIFARIISIFSVANVALTNSEIVRQRHLDVAKAAKRAPGSDGEETGDLPPESSSRILPHDSPKDKWAWLYRASPPESPAASDRSPPNADFPSSPEFYSTSENRITTQASGATTSSSSGSVHMGKTRRRVRVSSSDIIGRGAGAHPRP